MLPSRTTLMAWNPDSLITSAAAINSAAGNVSGAVKKINQACQEMPEMKSWSGRAHDAAAAMFTRADRDASKFSDYAAAVASALSGGAESIGSARRTLLAKADEVDAGPLNVTDQWVVLIDPVMTSEDELAKLKARAQEEQGVINACSSPSATLTTQQRTRWWQLATNSGSWRPGQRLISVD
ncbi:WXG100 family type VII secretion target [Mycobacterium sp. SMC-16]|uniref:WXG100 family type VII secretion target n=1 Tax=Mycobacterium sp. SMC-16 TaxID=3385967 RepID=UPI00390C47E3